MKDYYEILGLDEDASQEEIRERWLELSKLYHPDVLKSSEADERIKEINEAYQVLKDYSSRLEYDLKRALQKSVLRKIEEKEEKKSPWPKVIWPAGVLSAVALIIFYIVFKTPPQDELTLKKPVPKQDKIKEIIPPPAPAPVQMAEIEKGKLQEIPKAIALKPSQEEEKPITAEKKLAPSKIEPAKPQEKKPTIAKVIIKEAKKEPEKVRIPTPLKTPQPAKTIPPGKPAIQPQKQESRIKPGVLEKPKDIEKSRPSVIAQTEPSPVLPAQEPQKIGISEKLEKPPIQPQKQESPIKVAEMGKPKEIEIEKTIPSAMVKVEPPTSPPAPGPKEFEVPEKLEKPRDMAKAPPPEAVKTLIPQPPELKQEQKAEKVEKTKEPPKPVELVTDMKPEPVKVIPPERPQIMEAKKPEKLERPEKAMPSKEVEVKKFLADYVSKYQQKDVEGFIANFSAQAIQNQKYKLADIKKIYKNFFDRSQEVYYSLEDVQTADHPQGLEVKAKYELHQVAKKDGEKKFWKGQIRWILIKENGQLKIISLDYQHQK